MIKQLKKIFSVAALVIFSLLITNTALAAQNDNRTEDIFRSGKEILYVLMYADGAQEMETDLREEYGVSDEQISELRNLALRQHNNCKLAKSIWNDSVKDYNNAVKNEACIIDDKMRDTLEDKYDDIKEYLMDCWKNRKDSNGIATYSDKDVMVVWATQYDAYRSFEVSLPDQRLKMSYPNYTLSVVSYNKEKSVNNVPVGDVGPWNINDNYWDNNRRIFSDLELGRPEAAAAYYDNYNDGCDEYGRIVSNPAGIDLSREVASMLGFGSMESGWVSIYLNF